MTGRACHVKRCTHAPSQTWSQALIVVSVLKLGPGRGDFSKWLTGAASVSHMPARTQACDDDV